MPIAITHFQDGTTADFPLDILFSGSEEQRLAFRFRRCWYLDRRRSRFVTESHVSGSREGTCWSTFRRRLAWRRAISTMRETISPTTKIMATVIISTIENKHPVFVYQLTPAAEVGEARQGYIGLLNNPTALRCPIGFRICWKFSTRKMHLIRRKPQPNRYGQSNRRT